MINRLPKAVTASSPTAPGGGAYLAIDPAFLEPLVRQVIEATLAASGGADSSRLDDRLAFSEAEAARLLSLQVHQLRDERLRGRIKASVGAGRKVLYSRQDLLDYLAARCWEADSQ